MPRLLLITASSPEIRQVRRSRVLNFQQITMPYLAARVPAGWHVEHVDEEVEPIDWNGRADVVGITFHTPSAYHAYRIAARFRSQGTCVALGGPHVTLLPEEATRHADVVFVGEAEGLWEDFLRDFQAGSYLSIYRQTRIPSLDGIPRSHKAFFHRRDLTGGLLFATRGCPNRCDFCTISVMYRNRLRRRPVSEVAAEYASFRGKVIIFWDDNIAADLEYAKELCRAIAPYRKWWSSQASIHAGHDDEFLEAAAGSGCKQLFLGLESISRQSMEEVNKGFNKVEEYSFRSVAKRLLRSPVQLWWTLPLNLAYSGKWWIDKRARSRESGKIALLQNQGKKSSTLFQTFFSKAFRAKRVTNTVTAIVATNPKE